MTGWTRHRRRSKGVLSVEFKLKACYRVLTYLVNFDPPKAKSESILIVVGVWVTSSHE